MSEYQGCDNCRYTNRTKDEFPCFDCTHNAIDRWKPMTNADRIRNMTDEELAEFLVYTQSTIKNCMIGIEECKHENTDKDCKDCFLEWLQAEVEDE